MCIQIILCYFLIILSEVCKCFKIPTLIFTIIILIPFPDFSSYLHYTTNQPTKIIRKHFFFFFNYLIRMQTIFIAFLVFLVA